MVKVTFKLRIMNYELRKLLLDSEKAYRCTVNSDYIVGLF